MASALALICVGAGSTVTVQLPDLPFCGTQVITALPSPTAVTTPVTGSTLATPSLLEVKLCWLYVPERVNVTFVAADMPTPSVRVLLEKATEVGFL